MAKKIITENKVILNERGEVEFIMTEGTRQKGYFDVEEAKRLGAQIIREMAKRNGIQG